MSFWLIVTPLISAILCWFFSRLLIKMLFRPIRPQQWLGFSVQGWIPKHQLQLSVRIGNLLSQELVSFKQIEEKILDESTLQKIIPEIETHIDHFLRVKLKDAMPMIAMFVGDKTIVQLKEVFMTEMKTLFPEIMRSYVDKLKDDLDIGERVAHKLAILPAGKIESFVLKTIHKELALYSVSWIGNRFYYWCFSASYNFIDIVLASYYRFQRLKAFIQSCVYKYSLIF